MTDQYNVNRIHSWPDGEFYVEVVAGIDSGSPDRLGIRYQDLGEGMNYDDPKCAAIAAVHIQRAWFKDQGRLVETSTSIGQNEIHPIGLVHNGKFAGEMGVPGQECSARELFMWARKEYLGLPKCDRCGEILGSTIYHNAYDDWTEERFCSEYCVEEAYEEVTE